MTTVSIFDNTRTRSHVLTAVGHATGSETVCAAVSCLLYALAGYLINLRDVGLATEYENSMGSGDVTLSYSGLESVEAAYGMATIGLLQLELAYPDYLRVICYQDGVEVPAGAWRKDALEKIDEKMSQNEASARS